MRLLIILFFLFCSLKTLEAQDLKPYLCLTKYHDSEKWLKQYERNFDSNLVLTQKKQYHALSISVYGILRYHDYLKTGNSKYYDEVKHQYRYFCDSSKIHFTADGKGIGLPYTYNFHDLKAPWYSGMTQGMAISFLLRYYLLTKDKTALDKVKKIAYFMLQPVKENGTISKTKEGLTFIEEYPKSKSHPQVLNGFINGLIGLHEYLVFFPNDTLAKRVHDESYASMMKLLNLYDTPNWTNYDRSNGKVSNLYMRYQLSEFEHLYSIYGDKRLIHQMMIWSYFAHNKFDNEIKFYRDPKYNFGTPFSTSPVELNNLNQNFDSGLTKVGYTIRCKKGRKTKVRLKTASQFIVIELKNSIAPFSSKRSNLEFFADSTRIFIYSNIKTSRFSFDAKPISDQKIEVKEIKMYEMENNSVPKYHFYRLPDNYKLEKGQKYQLETQGNFLNSGQVFYRSAEAGHKLTSTKYEVANSFSIENPIFIPEKTGVYEFFISIPALPNTHLKHPKIVPLN